MKRLVPWLPVIIGLLVTAAVVRQCRNVGGASYQTATIARGPITQAVTATGTLNPVVNVQVGSQVSGNIAKLFVDYNSRVKAGRVVAQTIWRFFGRPSQTEGDVANAATLESQK
jgi:HlyD family secretion protein